MKLKSLALATALAFALPLQAQALQQDLPFPIVELMPQVKQLTQSGKLQLNAEQKATIDNWMAEAPKKRKEVEAQYMDIRQQLRDAILDNADRFKREALIKELQHKDDELIKMRSLCNQMLVKTLTAEQRDMVVKAYRDGLK
jgi:hypothetical protein